MLHFVPPTCTAPSVRLANLADPQERARLSAWIDSREEATAFHRIAWGGRGALDRP